MESDSGVEPTALAPQRRELASYGIMDTAPEARYDDIATLAAQICGTPVAYVSFVDENRQWFKAKVGFDMAENTLDKSFCLHTLRQGSMLVIPDLKLDARTLGNGLVTDVPHLRFYAGAPLQTSDGVTVGTLCVMDVAPHETGLRPDQERALLALSRQVMELLELRKSLREIFVARATVKASEGRYHAVFESAVDYAIIVMDREGRVTNWNEGAFRILGWTAEEMCGNRLEIFFTPEDCAAKIPQTEMAQARTRGRGFDERWHLRKSGQRFWANGEMMPLREEDGSLVGYVKILRDRTQQREAETQQKALLELADRMRDAATKDDVMQAAVDVLRPLVAFDRAGYGRLDETGENVYIEKNWSAEGVTGISGMHRISDFVDPKDGEEKGEMLVVGDERRAMISSRAIERGKTVSIFFVHSQQKQDWTEHEIHLVRTVGDRARAVFARLEAEERQQVLNAELSHRMKNTLAMVQGIANQTLKGISDREAVQAFEQRIAALSAAHDILLRQDWAAGRIRALVSAVMALHAEPDRVDVRGADIELGPKAALSLSLLLHELATNAVKYGALSNKTGRVSIAWTLNSAPDGDIMSLTWKETGGPTITEPSRKGFGSKLISLGLAGTRDVKLTYPPAGFQAEFHAPLNMVRET